MKEIDAATEKVFLTIPEHFRDWATVRFVEFFLQSGPNHGLKSNRARSRSHKVWTNILEEKPVIFSELADEILEGFDFNISNEDNLPNEGAEIMVINEPNTGPLRGTWVQFIFNWVVAKRRGYVGNYEPRWVQKVNSDNPIVKDTPLKVLEIQKRRLSHKGSISCSNIIVDRNDSVVRRARSVSRMIKHLEAGGVLALCPEGIDGKVLSRGKKEVGELISFLFAKTRALIRPVSAWDNGRNLYLNFGERIDQNLVTGNDGREIADAIMTEIAKLLPEPRRGAYRRAAVITQQ